MKIVLLNEYVIHWSIVTQLLYKRAPMWTRIRRHVFLHREARMRAHGGGSALPETPLTCKRHARRAIYVAKSVTINHRSKRMVQIGVATIPTIKIGRFGKVAQRWCLQIYDKITLLWSSKHLRVCWLIKGLRWRRGDVPSGTLSWMVNDSLFVHVLTILEIKTLKSIP